MNWKHEAMEKLRRFDAMRHAADNIPRQLRQLEEDATSLRSARLTGTKVRSSGYEDRLMNNLMARQELERNLEQTVSWLQAVEDALSVLEPEERRILQQMYICPVKGASTSLSQDLGLEHSSIYRKRDKALMRFTMALYGAVES